MRSLRRLRTLAPGPVRLRRLSAWIGLAATLCLPVPGSAANGTTLSAVYELARDNDPQFAAARAAAAAGMERKAQGLAGMLPTVSVTGAVRDNADHGEFGTTTSRRDTTHLWSISASVPVVRRGNLEAWRQGDLQATLASQQLRIAEQDLLLRVARVVFDVLQAQDVLASMTAQRSAMAQQLTLARRSHQVGMAPVTDVNDAQARHDLAVAQELAARHDIELKRQILEKSIAQAAPPLAALDDQTGVDLYAEPQMLAWMERAPSGALTVQAAETAQQVAEREVARQQAGHLPTLDLVVSHSENHNNRAVANSNGRQTSVGLELAMPLYQGGATLSRVREAVANLERARQDLANARAQARLDARQAWLGVQSGLALTAALRQALASAQTQVQSLQRGLEVGLRTRTEVLNATQQLYATRKDLAAVRYQSLMSSLQLKAAAGLLAEADLQGLDRLLSAPAR